MFYFVSSLLMFVMNTFICFYAKSYFYFVFAITIFASSALCYFLYDTKYYRIWTSIAMLTYIILMIVSIYLHFVYGKYIADYALATMQTAGLLVLSTTYHFKKPRKKIS